MASEVSSASAAPEASSASAPAAEDEEETHTQYKSRLCTYIRARYLEHGLEGEFQVGRTIGMSTKALLVVVSGSDGDGSSENIPEAQVGRAAAALVLSTIASMMKAGPTLPRWCEVVRIFSVSICPLGFNVGVGVNVHLRATASSLAAAERRRLEALPPPAAPASGVVGEDASDASAPPSAPAWRPGHYVKKALAPLGATERPP